jgi:LmbE family N-acetylglucosaminyl deacetylase
MKKILAIGAHPDDVEFGAAGLLLKEITHGSKVKIIITSLGEAGSSGTPTERKQEAEDAADLIGAEFEYLPMGGDCHLVDDPKTRIALAEVIRNWKPDIVLAPSLTENQHPDHLAVAQATRAAARLARYGGLAELKALPTHAIDALYYYPSSAEVDRKPDIVVDVSEHYTKWAEAMNLHTSQMKTRGYIDLVTNKAKYFGSTIGVEYAVPLWTNDPVTVDSLASLGSSRKYK